MKKHHKTRLRLERDTLRTLHAHELGQVDGAAAIPTSLIVQCPPPPLTQGTVNVCCA